MLRTSFHTTLLSVCVIGAGWSQEPVEVAPQPGDSALAISIYGEIEEEVGQVLKPSLLNQDGTSYLVVEGAVPFDEAYLLIGSQPASIELPWGDRIQVVPEGIFPLGRFDADGSIAIPIPVQPEFVQDRPLYLQVVEELRIDPYPWSWQSTPGIQLISVVAEAEASGSGENALLTPPQVQASLVVIDELESSRYEVWLESQVPHGAYELVVDQVTNKDSGTTEVRAALITGAPEPGEKEPRRIMLRVPVGQNPGARIDVLLARREEGVHYFVPPPYKQIARFQLRPSTTNATRLR